MNGNQINPDYQTGGGSFAPVPPPGH
jgi:hypothetical protein